jgi:hypothetical protein
MATTKPTDLELVRRELRFIAREAADITGDLERGDAICRSAHEALARLDGHELSLAPACDEEIVMRAENEDARLRAA